MRILMIGPTFDHATGGIPAVVEGLMKGFSGNNEIDIEYSEYCCSMPGINILKRLALVMGKLLEFPFRLRQSSPDLVHMHTSIRERGIFRDTFFVLIIKAFRIPLLLELHGGRAHMLRGITRWAFNLVIGSSNSIILTSNEQREELISLYPAFRNRFSLIPNPLDLPPQQAQDKGNSAIAGEQTLKIIFAARLIKGKGAAELLSALSKLEVKDGWVAEIYGEGPETGCLLHQITNLGLDDKVVLKGNIPLPELLQVYSNSDIFIFPSSHHEGFPMAFFFAVASGMAIVSSRVAPVPDYLKETDNCLFVDPDRPEGMARAIDQLLSDRELRSMMRVRNTELGKQFSPENIAATFAEVYVDIAKPH